MGRKGALGFLGWWDARDLVLLRGGLRVRHYLNGRLVLACEDPRFNSLNRRLKLAEEVIMDWSGCQLIEIRQDVQRGRPVVRGTRVTVDDSILGNWEAGLDGAEIAQLFPAVTIQQIKEILSYAAKHQANVPRTA